MATVEEIADAVRVAAEPRTLGWQRVRGKPHLSVRAEKKFGSLEPLLEYVLRNLLRMTPPRQTRESSA